MTQVGPQAFHGLQGKVALITGANGPIGREYVQALLTCGARVLATDLTPPAEDSDPNPDSENFQFVAGDVRSSTDWQDIMDVAVRSFGSVDVLINNAAIYQDLAKKKSILELASSDWETVMDVNVRGVWEGIRAVAPVMEQSGSGSIINISSATARAGGRGFAHYITSKAAVEGLTRAAATELGSLGIRVNAVAPGLVDNASTRTLNSEEYVHALSQQRPLSRPMNSKDLVGAILFLSSPESSFMTGQTLVIDGGGIYV